MVENCPRGTPDKRTPGAATVTLSSNCEITSNPKPEGTSVSHSGASTGLRNAGKAAWQARKKNFSHRYKLLLKMTRLLKLSSVPFVTVN